MVTRSSEDYDSTVNLLVARDVTNAERSSENTHISYRLPDEKRDMIIFHTRQDAAHALLNTITLLKKVDRLTTLVKPLLGLVLLLTVALIVVGAAWLKR